MLKQWSIENFKSVNGQIALQFAPITIFAGANSSGKSTILHSILLAKQTLRYAPISRPLALNGPILKLGFFNEIKNTMSTQNHIGFGFEFDFTTSNRYEVTSRLWTMLRDNFRNVLLECQFEVLGSGDVAQLYPVLKQGAITARRIGGEAIELDADGDEPVYTETTSVALTLRIDRPQHSFLGNRDLTDVSRSDGSDIRPVFSVAQIDEETRSEVCENKADAKVVGAKATHFMPGAIHVSYDANKTKAELAAYRLCSLNPYRTRFDAAAERIPQDALEYVFSYLEQHGFERLDQASLFGPDATEKGVSMGDAITYLRDSFRARTSELTPGGPRTLLRSNIVTQLRATLQDVDMQSQLTSMIAQKYGPDQTTAMEQTNEQGMIANYVSTFLSSRTRYLGPLRDEPRPLYPLEEVTDATDVGYRGEHTAAVLELNRWNWIDFVAPPANDLGLDSFKKESSTLIKAVTKWLDYMGVASGVRTSDMGKLGHQMQVQIDENAIPHDLTNVGVGVSQVLPIVVMALLAPSESLLIFEQPELHLHPRVQSRLADFFVGLSLLGKQCLIETHSEYLIQRFRRRIAEEDSDTLRHHIRAYFVDRMGGSSSYHPIEFSEYGAIAEWPTDFFDQSDREVERLLQAAAQKRSRRKKKPNI